MIDEDEVWLRIPRIDEDERPALLEDPSKFAQMRHGIGERVQDVGGNDGVERFVIKGEWLGQVALLKDDVIIAQFARRDLQHRLGSIQTGESPAGMPIADQLELVARATSGIQDARLVVVDVFEASDDFSMQLRVGDGRPQRVVQPSVKVPKRLFADTHVVSCGKREARALYRICRACVNSRLY